MLKILEIIIAGIVNRKFCYDKADDALVILAAESFNKTPDMTIEEQDFVPANAKISRN